MTDSRPRKSKLWLYRHTYPDGEVNPWLAFPLMLAVVGIILAIIFWPSSSDSNAEKVPSEATVITTTTVPEVHEPDPLHNFDDWKNLWGPKLVERYHFKEWSFTDPKDWWRIAYVTDDNRRCQGTFYAIEETVYIQEGSSCIKLLEPGQI